MIFQSFHFLYILRNRCICDNRECLLFTAPIRLVGRSSNTAGRVEISYKGHWGTVCHDDWDNDDATVVCRSLGLGTNGIALRYGIIRYMVWYDVVW